VYVLADRLPNLLPDSDSTTNPSAVDGQPWQPSAAGGGNQLRIDQDSSFKDVLQTARLDKV
jgi:hypothetical protein